MHRAAIVMTWAGCFVAWCLFWYGLGALLYWILFELK